MPLIKRVGTEKIVLYDLEESASLLGVTTRTLRSYAKDELIPCCRLRRKLYFTDRNISAFLKGTRSTRRKIAVDAPQFETSDYTPDAWESD